MTSSADRWSQLATPGNGFAPTVDYLVTVEAMADRFGITDPQIRAAFRLNALMILSTAYIEAAATTLENPDWVPYIPGYLPRATPNPDTVYAVAPIDAKGSYEIRGVKGTETIAAITSRKGGGHLGRRCGARVDEIDFVNVKADAAGNFSFLLSPERPAGYTGQWFKLHPETDCLMLRRVTKDETEIDGICGLLRIDRPAGPRLLSTAASTELARTVAQYATNLNEFLLGYVDHLRKSGAGKAFMADDQTEYGGLIEQRHYFHLYNLAQDEAIIVETDLPKTSRYWSVQVFTPFASTVDFTLHQSALNDRQAVADADGKVRIVLAHTDPGVPNWLDPAGWHTGGIQWRWNEVEVAPHPGVKKITLHDLRAHLPQTTPHVSPQERQTSLRNRAAFYQRRRK